MLFPDVGYVLLSLIFFDVKRSAQAHITVP